MNPETDWNEERSEAWGVAYGAISGRINDGARGAVRPT